MTATAVGIPARLHAIVSGDRNVCLDCERECGGNAGRCRCCQAGRQTGMLPEALADYPDAVIADWYGAADTAQWREVLEREMTRRDRSDRASEGRSTPPPEEWHLAAHAQWQDAETVCAGVLLNARGVQAGIDPFTLWSGPQDRAEAYASEELREYWRLHGRTDITTWRKHAGAERRDWRDRKDREAYVEPTDETPARGRQSYGPDYSAELRRAADRLAERRQEREAAAALERAESAADDTGGGSPVPAAFRKPRADVAVRTVSVVQGRALVDGDQTLRYIYTFLKHFAHWNSEAELIAATLWVAQTHARDDKGYPIAQYCARLAILGPSGSGKSWKSRLIGKLSYSGEILVEPTAPAFIDLCAENHTVIMTEADEAFRSPGRSRKILAVANASYEPDRSSSRKQGGVAVKIRLFCHLVLDGIDEVLLSPNRPDLAAMMSRCIIILSRRAPDGYRPPRFDSRARATAEMLSQRATAWMAQEVAAGMADDVPVVPEHLGNRPFALWEPLFIVARRADLALRARVKAEGGADPGYPWSDACTDACEQLEQAVGVPDQTPDQVTELDRQMAAYGLGEDVYA